MTERTNQRLWEHILQKNNIVVKKKERDKIAIFENYYPSKKLEEVYSEEPYKKEPRSISIAVKYNE
jgi:hypothetical protein